MCLYEEGGGGESFSRKFTLGLFFLNYEGCFSMYLNISLCLQYICYLVSHCFDFLYKKVYCSNLRNCRPYGRLGIQITTAINPVDYRMRQHRVQTTMFHSQCTTAPRIFIYRKLGFLSNITRYLLHCVYLNVLCFAKYSIFTLVVLV